MTMINDPFPTKFLGFIKKSLTEVFFLNNNEVTYQNYIQSLVFPHKKVVIESLAQGNPFKRNPELFYIKSRGGVKKAKELVN